MCIFAGLLLKFCFLFLLLIKGTVYVYLLMSFFR